MNVPTESLYTSAICELERAADFVDSMKTYYAGIPACEQLATEISQAIRDRTEKLRRDEERGA
jgi:hypothetical protein